MIVLSIIGMTIGLLTLAIGMFPCGTINAAVSCAAGDVFLPIPQQIYDAITAPIGWLRWLVYLPGDDIGNATVQAIGVIAATSVILMLWHAVRNLDVPILNRWIK